MIMTPDPEGNTFSGAVAPGLRMPHAVANAWQVSRLTPSLNVAEPFRGLSFFRSSISPVFTSTARGNVVAEYTLVGYGLIVAPIECFQEPTSALLKTTRRAPTSLAIRSTSVSRY